MLEDSLLYPVFDHLRRHRVPLGVSEYLDAVQTVRAGMMLEDWEQLKRLCRLLWAKSPEDQELFDVTFARFVEPRLRPVPEPQSVEHPSPSPKTAPEEVPPIASQSEQSAEKQITPAPETTQQAMQAVSLDASWPTQTEVSGRPYQLTSRYPMGTREIATAWRHLRKLQRTGPPVELDVQATIRDICRKGALLYPTLRPRRRNQAKVVLLIDQHGSMAPFAPLVEILVDSIQRGGLLGRVVSYYFHDCPEGVLYAQRTLIDAQLLEEVLMTHVRGCSVLIVSDAGAARGYYDEARVRVTQAFLKTLSIYTYAYAWLNPVPSVRWSLEAATPESTAKAIACCVPMFALTHNGLNDAVNILRGYPFPPGITLNV